MVDPRPDLVEDSALWKAVLVAARGDRALFGLLHGLRCGGARLRRRPNGRLKLDYRPLLSVWDERALLRDWLEPNRAAIVAVFLRVASGPAAPRARLREVTASADSA